MPTLASRALASVTSLAALLALAHCASAPTDDTACTSCGASTSGPGVHGTDGGLTMGAPGTTTLPDGAVVPALPDGAPAPTLPDGALAPLDGSSGPGPTGPVNGGSLPRMVAYVNVLCGFGIGTGANGSECLANPDPTVNYVQQWEDAGTSPITHYVLSFLSFQGGEIQTDPGEIWKNGGGSTTDFTLEDHLKAAMTSAHAHGKKIMLSLGGEVGSSGFLSWWTGLGATSADRVTAMRAKLQHVADQFASANGVAADGFDVDIELGGVYQYGSDKYVATRDLISAIPPSFLAAFVPQIGNGLCAAPVVGDKLPPPTVLGGQCQQPVNGDDSSWVLARIDKEATRADGSPRLDYWGIQYYNAGEAACCGGGTDAPSMADSTVQTYVDLANGWAASGDTTNPSNPWHAWAYYPGPWAAFDGFGADRLVLGKPGCQGCAGSDYMDLAGMSDLIGRLDGKLAKKPGGILFWDLGRLFGNSGTLCVSGQCQPSWGTGDVRANLATLAGKLGALHTK
jgi:hypothetical protein